MEFYLTMKVLEEGETFVTRKIIIGLCNIKLKKQKTLYLGNIKSKEIGDMLKIMLKLCGK